MSKPAEHTQPGLRLHPAPRAESVEYTFRTFGTLLIPLETLRVQWFRNLNPSSFTKALEAGRIPLPIVRLDPSRKGQQYVDARHLAAYIDLCTYQADEALAQRLETTPHTTNGGHHTP
ncbi:Pyocin activator protein PrtN [compost metagenome]